MTAGAAAVTAPPATTAQGNTAPRPTSIVAVSGMVAAGATVSVTAQGQPGATCSIAAGALGAGTLPGTLAPRAADGNGRVAWSWTVPPAASGNYTVTVTCGTSAAAATLTVQP
jgi:hypothetical protein